MLDRLAATIGGSRRMDDRPEITDVRGASLRDGHRQRGSGAERIWIAWESQRRSANLAGHLGARLVLYVDEDKRWLRYPVSIARTVRELRARRGQTVFVQNPSMVLAAVACLLKRIFGYRLVVDRHSNFSHLFAKRAGLKRWLSDRLSGFTLRHADLTIVTNGELLAYVEAAGARGFVLPDPIPELSSLESAASQRVLVADRPLEILFVSSWASDEPIGAAIEACRLLGDSVIVRITGRIRPSFVPMLGDAPKNFQPTGFLSDADYFRLMAASDAVMAVTDRQATLVCGGYEGVALGKPLILGDTATLRAYFDAGCVYTDGSSEDLVKQWSALRQSFEAYCHGIRDLRRRRSAEWERSLLALEGMLADMAVSQ
jgi:Glycosyl transferase 4-like domain